MKRTILFFGSAVIIIVVGFIGFQEFTRSVSESPLINIHGPTSSVFTTAPPSSFLVPAVSSPATTHVIAVPFSSQAPTGNWDTIHEEMCEEMTIIMAHAWVNGISLTPAFAEGEITKLVNWENANFGTYTDTSAKQTAQMAQAVYGLHTSIINNPSIKDIKNEIDKNHIVIMGMAGRMLHNPNYTGAGPLYHMLLIKGYDATGFITNDDGTRKGDGYHYSYDILMAAAHDWNGDPAGLTSNPSVAIVVSK